MPEALQRYEAWFVTRSQGLYGEDFLQAVAEDTGRIAAALDSAHIT